MANPWEKYQSGQSTSEIGAAPWERYRDDSAPPALSFTNQAIARGLGAPVDLINFGLDKLPFFDASEEPIGGSKSIERLMGAGGIELPPEGVEPETLGGRVARGVGDAAAGLVPFTKAAQLMSASSRPLISAIGQSLTRPIVNAPVRSVLVEGAGGAGAGAARHVAEEQIPEEVDVAGVNVSPGLKTTAELVGGFGAALSAPGAARLADVATKLTPGVAVARRSAGMAVRTAKGAVVPFTEAGGLERARRRLRGLSADPEADTAKLNEPTISNLTPAEKLESGRFLGLETAVRE